MHSDFDEGLEIQISTTNLAERRFQVTDSCLRQNSETESPLLFDFLHLLILLQHFTGNNILESLAAEWPGTWPHSCHVCPRASTTATWDNGVRQLHCFLLRPLLRTPFSTIRSRNRKLADRSHATTFLYVQQTHRLR